MCRAPFCFLPRPAGRARAKEEIRLRVDRGWGSPVLRNTRCRDGITDGHHLSVSRASCR
jgi:hypothetical protein